MDVQLNVGFEIQRNAVVIIPKNTVAPKLKIIWYLGIRIAFDWRYYFD